MASKISVILVINLDEMRCNLLLLRNDLMVVTPFSHASRKNGWERGASEKKKAASVAQCGAMRAESNAITKSSPAA